MEEIEPHPLNHQLISCPRRWIIESPDINEVSNSGGSKRNHFSNDQFV
jgi:hypothetical protein